MYICAKSIKERQSKLFCEISFDNNIIQYDVRLKLQRFSGSTGYPVLERASTKQTGSWKERLLVNKAGNHDSALYIQKICFSPKVPVQLYGPWS